MKKTHRVYARETDVRENGVKTSKGHLKFGKSSAVYVDEATAKEVDEQHGLKGTGDVMVVKDEQYDRAVTGEGWDIVHGRGGDYVKTLHRYRFSGMELIDGQEWHIWSDGTKHRFKERT